MPPMEVDGAYYWYLSSCELHSRSLAVRRTVAHGCWDCTHVVYAISRLRTRVAQIPRLRRTYTCSSDPTFRTIQLTKLHSCSGCLLPLDCCMTMRVGCADFYLCNYTSYSFVHPLSWKNGNLGTLIDLCTINNWGVGCSCFLCNFM